MLIEMLETWKLQKAVVFTLSRSNQTINGHDSGTDKNWRYLPYIRPIVQAYVRVYPHKTWPYMVQYLHFRILEFPLKQ